MIIMSHVCWALHKCKLSYLPAVFLHRSHSAVDHDQVGDGPFSSLAFFLTLYSY